MQVFRAYRRVLCRPRLFPHASLRWLHRLQPSDLAPALGRDEGRCRPGGQGWIVRQSQPFRIGGRCKPVGIDSATVADPCGFASPGSKVNGFWWPPFVGNARKKTCSPGSGIREEKAMRLAREERRCYARTKYLKSPFLRRMRGRVR